jgi:hypothetical protein
MKTTLWLLLLFFLCGCSEDRFFEQRDLLAGESVVYVQPVNGPTTVTIFDGTNSKSSERIWVTWVGQPRHPQDVSDKAKTQNGTESTTLIPEPVIEPNGGTANAVTLNVIGEKVYIDSASIVSVVTSFPITLRINVQE